MTSRKKSVLLAAAAIAGLVTGCASPAPKQCKSCPMSGTSDKVSCGTKSGCSAKSGCRASGNCGTKASH